jgi:hypothetical protein
MACGAANAIDNIHMRNINLIARDSFDIVCDKNGWQMATYLSIVNAVTGNRNKKDCV